MAKTDYGDITPRTAAYVVVDLLKRAMPYLCLEKFGQAKTLPAGKTSTMKWRKYTALPIQTSYLTEGVTPPSRKLTYTDISKTLYQMGDLVEITDMIVDTHEDPVLQDTTANVSEQAAKSIETDRFNTLKAGTNVYRAANVAARASVAEVMSRADQRAIVRGLERQEAQHITAVVRSTPSFNTENVLPTFVGYGHVDLKSDIRNLQGFIDVKDYGSISTFETEVGACEDVRYITSTIPTAWADGGSSTGAGTTRISTASSACDVYPVLIIGKDAYGIVALKGKFAITPAVLNPDQISKSDPLGQRGYVSWKTMQGTVILADEYMYRYECAATL
jgi:N4-gp56 family major capsid protein